jgi:sugar/nucleoside kinase (ribokinase family)
MISNNITVVGSIALDSLETPKGNREALLGGSAMYFSLSASLFSKVELIGIVGTDFPENGWETLKSKNIDYTNIEIKEGKTFSWGGRYSDDYSTRDTLFTELGVFETYKPVIKNSSNENGILFLANIHPSLQLDVLRQMESKISMVVSDTMNLWIDIDLEGVKEVISKSNIFLLNDEEAMQLTGITDMIEAGQAIQDMGPETVIIKLGGEGSLLIEKDECFHVPCVPGVDVYDPTGAGDSFAGGLIGFISQNGFNNKKDALIYASAIASFTVSDFGINKLLNLNFDDVKSRFKIIENIIKNKAEE